MKGVMSMSENSENGIKVRYAVILVDSDIRSDVSHQMVLKYFDDYCTAEMWIRENGHQYGLNLTDSTSRFFRVEKRFYLI